jgi:3-phosphoshikimate 1-carboxyvinyltransferase
MCLVYQRPPARSGTRPSASRLRYRGEGAGRRTGRPIEPGASERKRREDDAMTIAALPDRPIRRAGRVEATLAIPGSKSITNRALLVSALADGVSILDGALFADDTFAFLDCLAALGVRVEADEPSARVVVHGCSGVVPERRATLASRDSGTTGRFLIALAAASEGTFTVDGSAQLRSRPMRPVLDAIRAQGATTEPPDAGSLPVTIHGGSLRGGRVEIDGSTSSQFVSALLMAGPLAGQPLEIVLTDVVSTPYLDLTARVMEAFGVTPEVSADRCRFLVPAPSGYRARSYPIEADASTASYFFAAAAVTAGRVTVTNLRRRGSLQGDTRFVDALALMGCGVADGPGGLTVEGPAHLRGVEVDMNAISDTFMTLACVAPFADGPTTITNIGHVRAKESDRIAAVEQGLRVLGCEVSSGPDWIRIVPSPLRPGRIDTHGDHRIAMSFAVCGLAADGVVIADPQVTAKTYPGFFEAWRSLEGA